jgi:ubiquinol-cytochrome c reductase cytochrome c1 subunit
VYTFLRSFYEDPSRPTGANNAVLPQTAMPNVLAPLSGTQRARFEKTTDEQGKATEHLVGLAPGLAGEMPAAAFDSFVRDTVAFLEYVAEPHKAQRTSLGVWVILFLLMFTVFAYFLYKEYWKDVK